MSCGGRHVFPRFTPPTVPSDIRDATAVVRYYQITANPLDSVASCATGWLMLAALVVVLRTLALIGYRDDGVQCGWRHGPDHQHR
jgi:hypothetical protein